MATIDPEEDALQKAARLKAEGNQAFRAGESSVAIRLYTEALEHGAAHALGEQHLLLSNRSHETAACWETQQQPRLCQS